MVSGVTSPTREAKGISQRGALSRSMASGTWQAVR